MSKALGSLIALALILALVGGVSALLPRQDLGTLPLSNHAAGAHVGEYSASTILPRIGDRSCKPIIVHACERQKLVKYICQLKPGEDLWGGVIVGFGDPSHPQGIIITGFAARLSYWEASAARDGCTSAVLVP